MRIIDCMPWESSVFFTLEKNDFIRPGFRHKPIRHHPAVVIAVLEMPCLKLKKYVEAIDEITTTSCAEAETV
ncbi:hypothetical protein [Nitrosovibrio tenuis]|uniref:Uncharacterized protein n=1 Tax=Nitrosovibrio tenuis TaxID=1233 RepID=A0A1H7PWM2_9PROT|nr:hypothetical protein [Nitrosovibrio tenuis]SEL39858.1 hypothetical protein SAMN05216387_11030 [Nitrosovibrio tenuis]